MVDVAAEDAVSKSELHYNKSTIMKGDVSIHATLAWLIIFSLLQKWKERGHCLSQKKLAASSDEPDHHDGGSRWWGISMMGDLDDGKLRWWRISMMTSQDRRPKPAFQPGPPDGVE